jgi:hypothetical protein
MLYQVVVRVFPTLRLVCSRQVYRAFIVMVVGRCLLAKKPTARAISRVLGVVSHDALTRLLTHTCWNASLLMNALLNQALLLTTGDTLPSYLMLDDVVIPKPFATWIAGAYWDWDHANKRKVFCHRLVVVVWTNGVLVLPVAFALWHKRHSVYFLRPTAVFSAEKYAAFVKQFPHVRPLLAARLTVREETVVLNLTALETWQQKLLGKEAFAIIATQAANHHRYRTKNELARCLIYLVARNGLRGEYITFDSWYASKENLNFLTRLGLVYYAAIPCSRNLSSAYRVRTTTPLSPTPMNVSTLAGTYATRDYVPYPQGHLRALSLLVNLPGLTHGAKLVIIKRRDGRQFLKQSLPPNHPIHTQKDKAPNTYLLTNNIFASTYQVIVQYRSRWTIEVMFRDLKPHLGLAACQHRNLEAVRRHVALVMLADVCLQLIRQESLVLPSAHQHNLMTIGDVKNHLQSQMLVQLPEMMAPGLVTVVQRPMTKMVFDQLTDSIPSVINHFSVLTMSSPHFKELDKTE